MTIGIVLVILTQIATGVHPQPQDAGEYRVTLDVDLVELYATVLDGQGRPVSGLRQEHFKVYEDGVQQNIRVFAREDTPVAAGLVVDHSGSMGRKLNEVITAARVFAETSHPEDQMFVLNFNENATYGLPPSVQFTNRPDELARANFRSPTTGLTALYDAVIEARLRLETARLAKKVLIVISDGRDNASVHTLAQVLTMARQSSVLIYAIGIFDRDDPDGIPGVLRRIARATGGEAFFPGQLSGIAEVSSRIARDIRNQYTIGYISSGAGKSGAYRTIRVTVGAPGFPGLSVRARQGYIPNGPVQGKGAK
jgi:VWFA-related protein